MTFASSTFGHFTIYLDICTLFGSTTYLTICFYPFRSKHPLVDGVHVGDVKRCDSAGEEKRLKFRDTTDVSIFSFHLPVIITRTYLPLILPSFMLLNALTTWNAICMIYISLYATNPLLDSAHS